MTRTHELINGKSVAETDEFRAYDSWFAAADDYAHMVTTSKNFSAAMTSRTDGLKFAEAMGKSPYATFEKGFFSKLVPNVRKLGLLEANRGYLRQLWGDAGLLQYEFADDTLDNYASYDEVARDRAEAGVE